MACILSAVSVNAAEMLTCGVNSDGVVTIEHQLPSEKKGADVSIIVYAPGKSASDVAGGNNAEITVIEANQTVSGDNGSYKFSFLIPTGSGLYNVTVSSSAGDENNYEFLFSDPQVAKDILKQLNETTDKDTFYTTIYGDPSVENDGAWRDLGFYISTNEKADEKKVSDLIYTYVNDVAPFDSEDIEAATKLFSKMYVIELLNEGKIIEPSEADKYLDIASEDFADFYGKSYIDINAKKEMYQGMLNKNFQNANEYSDALLEQLVLKTARYSDGYGNIRDILEKYQAKTGIVTTGYTSDNYKRVLGGTYADYTALKNALYIPPQVIVSGGGSSGGSGGSSSKVFGSSTNFTPAVKDTPAPTPIVKDETVFGDISDYSWAEKAILTLHEKGIVSGKGENEFYPQDTVSREEFTAMIVRALGIENGGETDFSDVDKDAWYAKYVMSAAENGIIFGVDENTFGVGSNITRQDIAVILARAIGAESDNTDENVFADDANISDYAKSAVYTMRKKGVVSGYENGDFMPQAFATRAEAALMVYRAFFG